MDISIATLPHFTDLPLPAYETEGSAGMDLRCALLQDVELPPGCRLAVPTGIKIAIPIGYEGQVRPRSGLALKSGLSVINSPGTIDSDYRGEIMVPLINHSQDFVKIPRGMRIAQLVIAPVMRIQWVRVEKLEETRRGEGGFGHTGV